MKLYMRLLQLHVSNQNLLKIYYALLNNRFKNVEYDLKKTDLDSRISIREEIKIQLIALINNLEKGTYYKNGHDILNFLFQGEFVLFNMLRKDREDLFKKMELDNVNKYYKTIYIRGVSSRVIDVLLLQKNKVEKYLLANI
ncbi:hypothetical protein [Gramella sp. AN32]|uniref:Uncharacterized protein n=1 Tax=Christiangramia antarctica TaxID=2058158 RepID=A0ABW5X6B5_9FLAO|nr:hypothetical protein [Gramella sp. AN32]